MPYNGAGVFNRVYNWVQDKANGIFVTASRMDTEMDGMATGLSTALTKDGQSTPTADIGMGGFKITNLAAGVNPTDAVRVNQVVTLAGSGVFFDAGNSGVAITINWSNGTAQFFTLTNNATVTLGNGINPGWYTLIVGQDATGGRTISWAGAAYFGFFWVDNASAPQFDPTALSQTYVYLYWDGAVWNQMKLGTLGRKKIYGTSAARITTAQAFTCDTSLNTVIFNSELTDTYGEYNNATGFFIPKMDGVYHISASIALSTTVNGSLSVTTDTSGTAYSTSQCSQGLIVSAGSSYTIQVSGMFPIQFTGYLRIMASGAGGGAGSIGVGSNMQITRIGDLA